MAVAGCVNFINTEIVCALACARVPRCENYVYLGAARARGRLVLPHVLYKYCIYVCVHTFIRATAAFFDGEERRRWHNVCYRSHLVLNHFMNLPRYATGAMRTDGEIFRVYIILRKHVLWYGTYAKSDQNECVHIHFSIVRLAYDTIIYNNQNL